MNNKPTHGGKRPGSGRKPTGKGKPRLVYCGNIEEDLWNEIMKFPPKARKFALIAMLNLYLANNRTDFISAFRLVLREWENLNSATSATTVEQSGNAPISE